MYPSSPSLQVVWVSTSTVETTWEQESNVPSKLIEQYEHGIEHDIEESFSSGGQTIDTLSTRPNLQPLQKRARRDEDVDTNQSGRYGNIVYIYIFIHNHCTMVVVIRGQVSNLSVAIENSY